MRRFGRVLLALLVVMTWHVSIAWAQVEGNPFQLENPFASKSPPGAKRVEEAKATIEPAQARRGETVVLRIQIRLAPGFHTYPTQQTDPNAAPFQTEIKLLDAAGLVPGELKDPPAKSKPEPDLNIQKMLYYEGTVVWEWPLKVPTDIEPGPKTVKVRWNTQVCDEKGCVPEQRDLEATVTVTDAPPVSPSTDGTESDATLAATSPVVSKSKKPSGLLGFILQGALWGLISLVTPCVFPMIPITVSFFLKQSEHEHHSPLRMASVYSLTIIVVLTLGAVLLLSFFQAASQHWATNLFIGALFIYFSLSLFGMYEIRLPAGLARITSAQKGRGGMIGTVFMALTFTIISFACVAPFLGGFAGLTASAHTGTDWVKIILGGLAFSTTFASPFFLLALFPSMLRRMPKSGSWMNTVKVVMGFLEVAAAVKFLRAFELLASEEPRFLTYHVALGLYVGIALLCGLYLLGLFRLPHDSPLEHLGVPRMMLSLCFISLGFYLMPALSGQRPSGVVFEWLDSFLLPDPTTSTSTASGNGKGAANSTENLAWSGNLQEALAEAFDKRRLVFIDFTGMT